MESTKVDRVDSQVRIKVDAVRTAVLSLGHIPALLVSEDVLVRNVHGVFPVEPAFVTDSDEMIAIDRLDVGRHGLYPVGDRRGRACSGRWTWMLGTARWIDPLVIESQGRVSR